jgi:hypothetical protein
MIHVSGKAGGCAGKMVAASVAIACAIANTPVAAQSPVMARPSSYATWNDKTSSYSSGAPIAYSPNSDSYANARTVQGVPNNLFSYVVTQGNPTPNGLGFLRSSVIVPAAGAAPARLFNLTLPAGVANTSLGGLIDSFGWGAADVVMDQCFGGGFAFNIAGSLQGATPAGGGAAVPPVNRIGYTFSAGANYNELAYGVVLPNGGATPATATAVGDFTQGQAYASTPPGPFGMSRAYRNGVVANPFTVSHNDPVYGIPNQVPKNPGPPVTPNLQAGGFESPVYASSDAPGAGGAINDAAANNARTYATAAANRWAVLTAFTPDRTEFSLDIQREYAALVANGVPQNHIAVLYGDGTSASLARFSNIIPANNLPDVNGALNAIGAGFSVPVQGAASQVNIAGLLNPNLIQNPGAPVANQVDYWQFRFNTGPGGARPAAGNNLLFYTTGHGSAVNVFGADVTVANRAIGNVFTTQLQLTGPDNVQIIPGTNITAQITTRASLASLASALFYVDGNLIGGATPVSVAGGDAFDLADLLGENGSLFYYDVTIPVDDFTDIGKASDFSFTITSADDLASFDSSLLGVSLMDGVPTICATGTCDIYTDLVAAPEASSLLLYLGPVLALGGLHITRRRRAAPPAAAATQYC